MENNDKNQDFSIKKVPVYPLTIEEMYRIPRFRKDYWAFPSYKTPKYYADSHEKLPPIKEKSILSFERPLKPQPNHIYLNDILKEGPDSPSPNEYQKIKPWFTPKELKEIKKIPKKFENYEKFAEKSFPFPGVGQYNLLESEETIKKKLETLKKREEIYKNSLHSNKNQYLNDEIYLASQSPGPGAYISPDIFGFVRRSLSPNGNKIKKAKKELKHQFFRSKSPDNKDYSPLPVAFFTFERYQKEENDDKFKQKTQFSYIGSDKRFRYPEQRFGFEAVPGPNYYDISIKWPEKVRSPKKIKKIINKIS